MRILALIKQLSPLLIILILSFFAWQALLSPGYFSMHDDQQIARLFELNKALMSGQFPVRWVENLGFGYGYALFNFYPPLAYYVGEIFHLVGFGFIDSIKLVWFSGVVGSGIAMYFFAKNLLGKLGGIVAALFYIYAPYHAVDAYVRGALAELSSFVWLPLILLFAYKTAKEGKLKHALWTGFFLALLMITHNLIFLPFFGIFTIWYFLMVLINKRSFVQASIFYLLASATAFGLTAFFWLPSLWEKQYTLVDSLLIKNLASYKIHFLCPEQLWNSPWGFGGSSAGCLDGVSFKIGKLHLLASLLSLIIIAKLWIEKNRKLSLILAFSFLLLSSAAFMTTAYSSFIWDHLKVLWYLQFPWRFLEFIVLFASLLAGSLVLFSKHKIIKSLIAAILISVLIFQNGKLFEPQKLFLTASDQTLTSDQKIKWDVSSTSFEYMPKGVATKITDLGVVWVDIDKSELAKTKYKVRGDWKTKTSSFHSDRFTLVGESQKDAMIEFQITNFPGWAVWIDQKQVPISDKNKYKLITVNIPPGNHEITGKFENTPVRSFGNALTLISLICLIGLIFRYGTRRNSQ